MVGPTSGLASVGDALDTLRFSGRYTEFGPKLTEKPVPEPINTGFDGDRPDPTLDR